ncbi:hypothetical protein CL619_01850 [archaeon]|nr:hypothetical protein [archaeon]|tara:strand:- start:5283 stop:7106 length:1824 start_codon:yes stop_codon:yes gene_type:complete
MGLEEVVLDKKVLERAHDRAILMYQRVSGIDAIPDLTRTFEFNYKIATFEDVVLPLIEDYQVIVACGGFYGDEGKGKLGNRLARECDLVVRLIGGENTGRSYIDPETGEKIVLHALPSATGHGIPCLIGSETFFDPVSVMENEIKPLQERGKPLDNLMFGNCYVTTPAHRIMDVLGSLTNASTGKGIKGVNESIRRKTALRLDDLVRPSTHVESKLQRDMLAYEGFIAATPHLGDTGAVLDQLTTLRDRNPKRVPDHVYNFAKTHHEDGLEVAIQNLTNEYQGLIPDSPFENRVCTREIIQKALDKGKRVLFELTQGHFLSNDNEVGHRDGTSYGVTASAALSGQNVDITKYQPFVVSIQKAPGTSRVGRGNVPFAFCGSNVLAEAGVINLKQLGDEICSDFDFIHEQYFRNVQDNGIVSPFEYIDNTGTYNSGVAMAITSARELNEKGATTCKPRITGWLDCVALAEVVRAQGPNGFLTAIDRANLYGQVGLTVGYAVSLPEDNVSANLHADEQGTYLDCNGKRYRTGHVIRIGDSMPNTEVLEHCTPIVRVMDGLKKNPINTDSEEVPYELQNLLATVEGLTDARFLGAGTGPGENEAVYFKRVA